MPPFAPGILGAKGSLYLTRATLFTHIATREATQAMADDLFAVVTSGKVKIRIDQRYALADVAQAHRDLEARKTTGSERADPRSADSFSASAAPAAARRGSATRRRR